MADEGFYQRYRPTTLDDVVGQESAVKIIRGFGAKIPHALMAHGPSGTGKTTLLRIVARMLGCAPDVPDNRFDYAEVNCASVESAIDTARRIQDAMWTGAAVAKCRVWLLDEVQSLSRSSHGQQALLKVLEDGPNHVYFLLATTDPKKVLPAIRNRCTQIPVRELSPKELTALVERTARAEKASVTPELTAKIVEFAGGSARSALVELEKVLGISDPQERLKAVSNAEVERAAFDLVKALLPWKGAPNWNDVAKVLTELKDADHDPESLRQMVMASARSQLLKTANFLAYKAIIALEKPFYDRSSGHALLAAAAYEICHSGKK